MPYTMDMSGEKEVTERELFPEGWRKLQITNVEPKKSKAGNDMLEITLLDVAEQKQDVIYAIMEQGKRWLLKKILSACGVKVEEGEIYTFELSDMVDKVIMGKNKHIDDSYIDRQGNTVDKKKNKIQDFDKYIRKEGEENDAIEF